MSEFNEEHLKDLLDLLQDPAGITIGEIEATFEVSNKTAYRWIAELVSRGHNIYKTSARPVSYQTLS